MSIYVYDFDVVGYAVDECRQVAHGIHVGFAVLLGQLACLLSADADLAQSVLRYTHLRQSDACQFSAFLCRDGCCTNSSSHIHVVVYGQQNLRIVEIGHNVVVIQEVRKPRHVNFSQSVQIDLRVEDTCGTIHRDGSVGYAYFGLDSRIVGHCTCYIALHCYAEVSRQVYRSVVDAEASVVVMIGEVQFLCLEAQLKGTCGRDVCDGNFRTIVCGNSVAVFYHQMTDAEVCRQGECSRLNVGNSCRDVAEVESDTDFGIVNLCLIKTFYSIIVAMIFEHHDLG